MLLLLLARPRLRAVLLAEPAPQQGVAQSRLQAASLAWSSALLLRQLMAGVLTWAASEVRWQAARRMHPQAVPLHRPTPPQAVASPLPLLAMSPSPHQLRAQPPQGSHQQHQPPHPLSACPLLPRHRLPPLMLMPLLGLLAPAGACDC